MFADPNTRWWSVLGLRLVAGIAAGIAFIGAVDVVAEAARADGSAAAVVVTAEPV
jgi:hypothetical protein